MQDAIDLFYLIFSKLITLVFDQLEIVSNVTVGWVLATIFIFGVLIRSLLNLPRSAGTIRHKERTEDNG